MKIVWIQFACKSKTKISNLCIYLWIEVRLSSRRDRCDQNMRESSAYLISPNYPRPYPGGLNCSYTIDLPWGRGLQLFWEYYVLGQSCEDGSIFVRHDTDSILIDTFKNTYREIFNIGRKKIPNFFFSSRFAVVFGQIHRSHVLNR